MQLLQKRRTPTRTRGGNNGGFPEPPKGDPVRVVRCAHPACGAETEIRLPAILSERIIQRVVCDGCEQTYEPAIPGSAYGPGDGHKVAPAPPPVAATAAVFGALAEPAEEPAAEPEPEAEAEASPAEYSERAEEPPVRVLATEEPAPETVGPIRDRRRLAVPAALASLGGRLSPAFEAGRDRAADLADVIRDRLPSRSADSAGGGRRGVPGLASLSLPEMPDVPRSRLWAWASVPLALLGVIVGLSLIQGDSGTTAPAAAEAGNAGAGTNDTRFIDRPGYSLALPAGWKKVNPPDGAVFAAEARDGTGDATLWIEEDPDLTLKQFEKRSVAQLEEIADNVRVADRVNAPTIEGSIIELRADTPIADGVTAPYRVTLRGAGPFRHYLATAQQPGAEPSIAADIELMHNSLRPEVKLAGAEDGE